MNSESKNEVIVSKTQTVVKNKKVTPLQLPLKPKYTGRDNYYFDEDGDYDHPYAECDICDRSVFKRTLVNGLCEMCDEKSECKRKIFKEKENKKKIAQEN